MLVTDRTEFDDHLGTLCAGFNVPVTELRTEAYWRGLAQMQLGQFARVVEHALGPDGPERIPTASGCWVIWRQIRNRRAKAPTSTTSDAAPAFDSFHAFGQRCLLRWVMERNGVAEDVLPRLVAEKNRLAAQFREVATECEVTAEEVREAMFAAFRRVA